MTKAEEILNKHLKIMDAETMIGKHGRTHKAVINAINEAINYSQCCTELKDEHPQTFEEWYVSEGYENKWTGFWREGKSVTYWTVKNRYNTYRKNL